MREFRSCILYCELMLVYSNALLTSMKNEMFISLSHDVFYKVKCKNKIHHMYKLSFFYDDCVYKNKQYVGKQISI